MYGVASMTAPLRRVALRRPGPAFLGADPAAWHYGPSFEPGRAAAEHAAFAGLLADSGVEILWMEGDDRGIADSVFTYDASLMTPGGTILLAPGKPLRAGEQELHRAFYAARDIPVIGELTGEARAEGGDTLWLDEGTLAVGRGFRTNQAGIEQLTALLAPLGVSVPAFDLPVHRGPEACLHLMSLVSPVDRKRALACTRLLPVGLWELMRTLGYELIEAPDAEFEASETLSVNILALAPGRCIAVAGFHETRGALEAAGIEVSDFEGTALCLGCEGGPTCLTRPILRREGA